MTTTQTGQVRALRVAMLTDSVVLEQALLRLYEEQTAGEKEAQVTTVKNHVGFSAFDAEILSSFAEQVKANRYGRIEGLRLTEKQRRVAERKLVRYAGQLIRLGFTATFRLTSQGA